MLCIRPGKTDQESPSTVGLQVWAVEGVARSILLFTDLTSFDTILNAIQATPELHGYLKDSGLWTELLQQHFGGKRGGALPLETQSITNRNWQWTSRERTCEELQQFLQSMDERNRFDANVSVVRGNIGTIHGIDGTPLDGIVFPTNPYLTNPFIASAGAVFRRAGHRLEEFVNDPSFRGLRPVGSAVVTPAFDAGVEKIIHCVGPSIGMPGCYELLRNTYGNAMNAVQNEALSCVALASISTGNLGIPCEPAAQVALRRIQGFMRDNNWPGKLTVVCYEEHVLRAFTDAKEEIMEGFNTVPPLPTNEQDDTWMHEFGRLRIHGQQVE